MAITSMQITTLLITTAVMIPLNALLLMLSTKIFKLADSSYKTAIKIALIVGVIGLVLNFVGTAIGTFGFAITILNWVAISILLAAYLVKTNYNIEWGKAWLVWLVWFAFSIVLGIVVGIVMVFVIGAIFAAGVLNSGAFTTPR